MASTMTSQIFRIFKTGFRQIWWMDMIEHKKRVRVFHYTFPRTRLGCLATDFKVGKIGQNCTFQNVSPPSVSIGEDRNWRQSKEMTRAYKTYSFEFWIFVRGTDYDVTNIGKSKSDFQLKWYRDRVDNGKWVRVWHYTFPVTRLGCLATGDKVRQHALLRLTSSESQAQSSVPVAKW